MNTIYIVSIYDQRANHWSGYSIRAWEKYCEKHSGINLIVAKNIDHEVFPDKPLHFQKIAAFKHQFPGDVAIIDADSLPHPEAPNIFEVHTDANSLYTWYDPGINGQPLTNPWCPEFNPLNLLLERYEILRLKEIEGSKSINPENWFHICAGLILFKAKPFNLFRENLDNILKRHYRDYCRDEAVFDYWTSFFYRKGDLEIRRLKDCWFNMPSFTQNNRYDFGNIEDSFSIQYVHCKNDLVEQSKKWWGITQTI